MSADATPSIYLLYYHDANHAVSVTCYPSGKVSTVVNRNAMAGIRPVGVVYAGYER